MSLPAWTKKRVVPIVGAIVVVAGVSIGIVVARQTGTATATAGPLHDAHGAVATRVTLGATGRIWTAIVEGRFDGDDPAHVTGVKLLPVPGFPTPQLVSTGYVTNGTFGSIMGPPKHDIIVEPLLHATVRPSDNHVAHMAGIAVVLRAGPGPGMYAIEGVQVEYTIGSTKHRSRLYTAVTACVPPRGKEVCSRSTSDKVYNRMVKDSGG